MLVKKYSALTQELCFKAGNIQIFLSHTNFGQTSITELKNHPQPFENKIRNGLSYAGAFFINLPVNFKKLKYYE